MGAYLSQAVTEKESSDGENERIKFGTSAMQGWRVGMEDAHSAILDVDDKNTSFFAVFDGHGGKEVAKFCARYLHQEVLKSEAYGKGDLCGSLISSFLRMDELMMEDKGREELALLAAGGEPSSCAETVHPKGRTNAGCNQPRIRLSRDPPISSRSEHSGRGPKERLGRNNNMAYAARSDSLPRREISVGSSPSTPCTPTDRSATATRSGEGVDGAAADAIVHGRDEGAAEGEGAANQKEERGILQSEDGNGTVESGNNVVVAQRGGNETANAGTIREVSPLDEVEAEARNDGGEVDYVGEEAEMDGGEEEEGEGEEAVVEAQDEEDVDVMIDPVRWQERVESSTKFQGPVAGCTAVVALVRGDTLVVANAGDSRCVISRNGQACDMSMDHKPDLKVERERILNAGGFVKEGRINASLNLSRAIGDMEYKQNRSLPPSEQIVTAYPEVRMTKLVKGDEFMILACDGVWDVMPSQRAVDFVRARLKVNRPLSSIIEELFDTCLAPDTTKNGLGCDNMTAVLVLFKDLIGDHSYQGDTAGVFRNFGRYSLRPRSFHMGD
ncbi:hypothetical protein CBR_g50412 [Chara braunii]|uniref:protein-serine/threonine phosphatase n=1 Tax=Chara braunii TaxID=69332 RepID=A0A388M6L8_CHABU|nr:hypothetical protein CBR_g50412 [Chara braunii]|eukprot:GBG90234.1 hypothetical protein CBR_g50412 [Chara braunii]